jgi:hypothetical protein
MHATLKFHKQVKKKLRLIKIFHKKHDWSVTEHYSEEKLVGDGTPTRGEKHGWSVTENYSEEKLVGDGTPTRGEKHGWLVTENYLEEKLVGDGTPTRGETNQSRNWSVTEH